MGKSYEFACPECEARLIVRKNSDKEVDELIIDVIKTKEKVKAEKKEDENVDDDW